ncbi:MAG TPA: hypothetical protein DCE10_02050 [Acidimicrobiaceae bacterium]|nr:hypothetical protein [Acidimicrobiaceae bacterium]
MCPYGFEVVIWAGLADQWAVTNQRSNFWRLVTPSRKANCPRYHRGVRESLEFIVNKPRALSLVRFLIVAMSVTLFGAACGGGDDSVSSRTRNAGAAATVEECFADGTNDQYEALLQENEAAHARLKDAAASWAEFGTESTEQLQALNQIAMLSGRRAANDYTNLDADLFASYSEIVKEGDIEWLQVQAAAQAAYESDLELLAASVLPASSDAGENQASSASEALENQNQFAQEMNEANDLVSQLLQQIAQQERVAAAADEAFRVAANATDSLLEELSGQELSYDGFFEDAEVDNFDELIQSLTDEQHEIMWEQGHSNEVEAAARNGHAQSELWQLQMQLADAQQQAADAEQNAAEGQSDTMIAFGDQEQALNFAAGNDDPCEALTASIKADFTANMLRLLESLRNQFNAPALGDDQTQIAINIDLGADSEITVEAIPVAVDDETQAQIPTLVVLAEDPTVEVKEGVNEIVVTPYAAQTIMNNVGVADGTVEIKTAEGAWQEVSSESLVLPVSDLDIRVTPQGDSEPAFAQSVSLQRVPSQTVLTAEALAAMLPEPSSGGTSGAMWVLYILIALAVLAVAFLLFQRRNASSSS